MFFRLRPERSWSLAARFTAWYMATAFLLVFGATGALYWALVRHLDQEDDEFLADRLRLLIALLAEEGAASPGLRRALSAANGERRLGAVHVRVQEKGRLTLSTEDFPDDLRPEDFPLISLAPGGSRRIAEVETARGRAYRIARALYQQGDRTWDFYLAFDRTQEEQVLAGYRRNLWIVLGIALAACGLIGYLLARRGLRPVAEIAAAARRVRLATLHERLPLRRLPTEVADLAVTFNAMLDRLDDSFRRLDRFAADIAHELRTPVNNLRGEAEVALSQPRTPAEYRDVLGSSLEECGRLTRLIDSLLFLARAGAAKVMLTTERVVILAELHRVREFYGVAATDIGVALLAGGEDVVVDLDRVLFQRAISNLVANALAHTSTGGRVTLSVRREGDRFLVEVADTGEGIPPEHLPHVFDRFYRADAARTTGAGRVGLGLAIVRSIAELHGGTAAVTSTVGRGTWVTLTFPLKGCEGVNN